MNKNYKFKSAKYELATDIAIGANSYAGVLSLPYLAPAVKLADTVANGYVTELDGITLKAVVNTLTPGTMIKAAGCDWDQDPTSLTLGESILEVTDMMVNERVCRKTIYPTWIGAGFSGRNGAIPSDFATFLVSTIANKTAEEVETRIWVGGASPTIAGFLSNDAVFDRPGLAAGKMAILGGVNGQAITAITATNVIEGFGKVYANGNANCPGIMGKADTQFLVNQKTFGLYMQALGESGLLQGVNLQGTNQSMASLVYLGVPVNVCPGMPDNAIILCQKSNLFFGTNLGTDMTEAKLIPFYEYDGSDNVGISMRMAIGVQIGVASNIVLGTTAAILPS
tara:strand:+ start:931 stop:1947 length:1017 start_codon:yes stop_codon:yes gene_type:complete